MGGNSESLELFICLVVNGFTIRARASRVMNIIIRTSEFDDEK